jgi:hypothetical protein
MKIKELKDLLNSIPSDLDDLEVWIDTDAYEGGKPVQIVQLEYAEDCSLDGDECGDEFLYEDEICAKLGLPSIPEDHSSPEFTNIIKRMKDLNYRWEGSNDILGVIFSKQILTIKF